MAKHFVGLICGATTGRVFGVVNPDDDEELDNPRFLLLGNGVASAQTELAPPVLPDLTQEPVAREPITMLKIPLALYMVFDKPDQIAAWVKAYIDQ